MTDRKPGVAIVVGVGPGLGSAIATRFAQDNFAIALVARSRTALDPLQEQLTKGGRRAAGFVADAANADDVAGAFALIVEQFGPPDVLVYNAGAYHRGSILDVTPDQFETTWRANCMGGFLWSQRVLPSMLERGRGTILFTGATASLRGSANFVTLAVGKFGLRALAQSAAREFGPRGIHVAHVVIDGGIDTPRVRGMMPDRASDTLLSPDAIAETYVQLHRQPKSAWTLEMDLRPSVEKF